MSSEVTVRPSSCRSRFSSSIRSEKGSRVRSTPCFSSAFKRKISYVVLPEVSVDLLLNESGCDWVAMVYLSPNCALHKREVMGPSSKLQPQKKTARSKNPNGEKGISGARDQDGRG